MRSILHRIGKVSHRVIVKIDAEGAECDIVLQTPSQYWGEVNDVFLEFHSTAPCAAHDLTVHPEGAGFAAGVLRFDPPRNTLPFMTTRGGAQRSPRTRDAAQSALPRDALATSSRDSLPSRLAPGGESTFQRRATATIVRSKILKSNQSDQFSM
jgi:hypothetical protein